MLNSTSALAFKVVAAHLEMKVFDANLLLFMKYKIAKSLSNAATGSMYLNDWKLFYNQTLLTNICKFKVQTDLQIYFAYFATLHLYTWQSYKRNPTPDEDDLNNSLLCTFTFSI